MNLFDPILPGVVFCTVGPCNGSVPFLIATAYCDGLGFESTRFSVCLVPLRDLLSRRDVCGAVVTDLTSCSISASRIPSKNGCASAYKAVIRSDGSIVSIRFINYSAFALSFPIYLFSKVSGLEMSGNLKPTKRGFLRNSSC